MSNHFYLNPDHTIRPCSLHEWVTQLKKVNKVADDIINGNHVSTIWLGIDHNYFGGLPLLFETMIFDKPKSGHDIYMDRYTTLDEAINGHKKAVQWVLDGCKNDAE
jgi:hypothetical protein